VVWRHYAYRLQLYCGWKVLGIDDVLEDADAPTVVMASSEDEEPANPLDADAVRRVGREIYAWLAPSAAIEINPDGVVFLQDAWLIQWIATRQLHADVLDAGSWLADPLSASLRQRQRRRAGRGISLPLHCPDRRGDGRAKPVSCTRANAQSVCPSLRNRKRVR